MSKIRLSLMLLLFAPLAVADALNFGPPPVRESAAAQANNLEVGQRKLSALQRASVSCRAMRVVLVHSSSSRMRRPVELAQLNEAEKAKMQVLISRMTAVKWAPPTLPNADLVVRLELLGQGNAVLGSVDYLDVVSEGLVNAQGYAAGARLLLRGDDAVAWHMLMRADAARSIAANPAPIRERNRPIRFAKVPAPRVEAETDFSPNSEPEEYYHRNCKDNHKGHKHKKKNHYCDHPQKK